MTTTEPPRIEFPCAYPVKVMGLDADGFQEAVLTIIRRHAPDLRDEDISTRASREGRYLSVRVTIRATGQGQLEALHAELMASGRVTLVL